jgi:hypothetical protein
MILSGSIVLLVLAAIWPWAVVGQAKIKIMPLGDSITGSPVSCPGLSIVVQAWALLGVAAAAHSNSV